jgi:hypothetical protein
MRIWGVLFIAISLLESSYEPANAVGWLDEWGGCGQVCNQYGSCSPWYRPHFRDFAETCISCDYDPHCTPILTRIPGMLPPPGSFLPPSGPRPRGGILRRSNR